MDDFFFPSLWRNHRETGVKARRRLLVIPVSSTDHMLPHVIEQIQLSNISLKTGSDTLKHTQTKNGKEHARRRFSFSPSFLTDADDFLDLDAGSVDLFGKLADGLVGVLVRKGVNVYPRP